MLISESQNGSLPHLPGSPDAPPVRVQPPTVIVYEPVKWEYRIITRDAADDPHGQQEELNRLGADGWELVGLLPIGQEIRLTLKRQRS